MNKFYAMTMLLCAAFSSAAAKEKYVGLAAGYSFADARITADKINYYKIRAKSIAANLAIGMRLSPGWRTELSFTSSPNYRGNEMYADGGTSIANADSNQQIADLTAQKSIAINNGDSGSSYQDQIDALEKSLVQNGDRFARIKIKESLLLINAYYDFYTGFTLTPYIVFGLGSSIVGAQAPSGSRAVNKSVFAYQVGVGASYKIAPRLHLDLSYRHIRRQDVKMPDGRRLVSDGTHTFLLGTRWVF